MSLFVTHHLILAVVKEPKEKETELGKLCSNKQVNKVLRQDLHMRGEKVLVNSDTIHIKVCYFTCLTIFFKE